MGGCGPNSGEQSPRHTGLRQKNSHLEIGAKRCYEHCLPRRAGPAPYGAGTLSTRVATLTSQCPPVPLWRMHPTGRDALSHRQEFTRL